MSYVKIALHCVWSTKERAPLLINKEQRENLFAHICANAKDKGIFVLQLGGYIDHIHIVLLLGKNQEIAKVMQMIKGEASHWYNLHYQRKLEWQDDYFAVSISEDRIATVVNYIANQEEHHKKKTFAQEFEEFMQKYKWG